MLVSISRITRTRKRRFYSVSLPHDLTCPAPMRFRARAPRYRTDRPVRAKHFAFSPVVHFASSAQIVRGGRLDHLRCILASLLEQALLVVRSLAAASSHRQRPAEAVSCCASSSEQHTSPWLAN